MNMKININELVNKEKDNLKSKKQGEIKNNKWEEVEDRITKNDDVNEDYKVLSLEDIVLYIYQQIDKNDNINDIQGVVDIFNKYEKVDAGFTDISNEDSSIESSNKLNGDFISNSINEELDIESLKKYLLNYAYEIKYKENLKDDLLKNNIDFTNRIDTNNEMEFLGQVSIGSKNDYFKSNDLNNMKFEVDKNISIESRINDDVVKNIKLMKFEDIKELSIRLRPRELGDMHIKLLKENDTMKAFISVSDKNVADIINKNIGDIKQHIESFGVKEITIVTDTDNNYNNDSFSESFEEQRKQNKNQENNKNRNYDVEEELLESKDESIKHNSSVNLLV